MLRSGASLGLALVGTGKHEDALRWFDDTIRQGRGLELLRRFTGAALNMSSSAFRHLFALDEARRRNEEAIELGHQADFSLAWIQAGIDILYADLLAGAYGSAERAWQGLWEETAATMGFHQWLMAGRLLVARAELDLELSDPSAAIGSSIEAIDHARATERPKQEVEAGIVLARALIASGERDEALTNLRRAVTVAERIGHPATMWRALVASARVLEEIGEDDGAAGSYAQAREIVERFAAGLSDEHRSTLSAAPDVVAARRGGG